jgi:hypothetical protein
MNEQVNKTFYSTIKNLAGGETGQFLCGSGMTLNPS